MVDSRQHPAHVTAASSQPGALTRAKSHVQMPAAVAMAVAIGGEADRVTREPPKGPLVTAPEISEPPIQGRRPHRGRRVHRRHRRDGGRGHVAVRTVRARRRARA